MLYTNHIVRNSVIESSIKVKVRFLMLTALRQFRFILWSPAGSPSAGVALQLSLGGDDRLKVDCQVLRCERRRRVLSEM